MKRSASARASVQLDEVKEERLGAPAIRSQMTWSGTLSDATKLRWSPVLPRSLSRAAACDALRGKPSRIQFCEQERKLASHGRARQEEREGGTHSIPQSVDGGLDDLEDELVGEQSSCTHGRLCGLAELGAVEDLVAEELADDDRVDVVLVDEPVAEGALACAWCAEEDHAEVAMPRPAVEGAGGREVASRVRRGGGGASEGEGGTGGSRAGEGGTGEHARDRSSLAGALLDQARAVRSARGRPGNSSETDRLLSTATPPLAGRAHRLQPWSSCAYPDPAGPSCLLRRRRALLLADLAPSSRASNLDRHTRTA